jgi:hypothetical protein
VSVLRTIGHVPIGYGMFLQEKCTAICIVCHQCQVLKYTVILFQGTLFPDRVKKPAKKAIQPFLTELERHWRESA